MTAALVGRFDPGTPEWFAARRNRLGGSEIAAVVGLSTYESRFSLWHRKAGLIGPQPEMPQMEWGKRLEPVIAAKFLESHPEFSTTRLVGMTFVNDDRPYQIASPDCLLWQPNTDPLGRDFSTLLEIKTARYDYEWGPAGTDQIPPGYRCQVLWYMDCLDLKIAHVAVLFSGSDYREYVVPYDEADAIMLRNAAERFIADLATGTRPDLDSSAATYETVRAMNVLIDRGEDVQITRDLAHRFLNTRMCLATAKDAARAAQSELLDVMGNSRRALLGDLVIARRQPGRGDSVSLHAVADDLTGEAA